MRGWDAEGVRMAAKMLTKEAATASDQSVQAAREAVIESDPCRWGDDFYEGLATLLEATQGSSSTSVQEARRMAQLFCASYDDFRS